MANLRVIKRRIKSVGGIRQITRAMEMVSATKLKKALQRVENARPYFDRMDQIIAHLMASISFDDSDELLHPLMKPGIESGNVLLVAMGSDKGLCSSYNSNIIKNANKFIRDELSDELTFRFDPAGGEIDVTLTGPEDESITFKGTVDSKGIVNPSLNDPILSKDGQYKIDYRYKPADGNEIHGVLNFSIRTDTSTGETPRRLWSYAENLELIFSGTLKLAKLLTDINITSKKVFMLAIGKKIFKQFSKETNPRLRLLEPEIDFDQTMPISQLNHITYKLTRLYTLEHVSRVCLLYTRYTSAARQKPIIEQFLPLGHAGQDDADQSANEKPAAGRDYIFEPSPGELFMSLIPAYARNKVFQALAHSFTSEHTIRMAAMRNATDNAGELIDDLTLERNKARQAMITKELSEIVSGAEALKG
ncbi:F0F1 ATP synthase subunit gamma [bacterium]|nr:F0F1 ATP synthase subunit gamma [bacterium]